MPPVQITSCHPNHHDGIISLWTDVFGYTSARNNPTLALRKKLEANDNLLFVATENNTVLGTVMAGYDGHRGWIYSLAVAKNSQRQGIGTALMHHAEQELEQRGCMKINLQILPDNETVQHFYQSLGYLTEPRINMSKQLPGNIPEE